MAKYGLYNLSIFGHFFSSVEILLWRKHWCHFSLFYDLQALTVIISQFRLNIWYLLLYDYFPSPLKMIDVLHKTNQLNLCWTQLECNSYKLLQKMLCTFIAWYAPVILMHCTVWIKLEGIISRVFEAAIYRLYTILSKMLCCIWHFLKDLKMFISKLWPYWYLLRDFPKFHFQFAMEACHSTDKFVAQFVVAMITALMRNCRSACCIAFCT